ncbi:MAG TPA: hypothetical protein VG940_12765, partial [Gemmatimonadales bacterium]|nr:hypothetical protein [Gemmatimonadales bacterium]
YAGDEAFGLGATPDGTEIWVTSYTGELRRFHSNDLSTITTLVLGGHLRRLAIDPAGRGAVIADEDGYIIVIK